MSFDERQTAAAAGAQPPAAARQPSRLCPYCAKPAAEQFCGACGRDTTAPRRPCPRCKRMSPSRERVCWNCGAAFTGDMWWKIPLIVFLFLLAFVISILLALVR